MLRAPIDKRAGPRFGFDDIIRIVVDILLVLSAIVIFMAGYIIRG